MAGIEHGLPSAAVEAGGVLVGVTFAGFCLVAGKAAVDSDGSREIEGVVGGGITIVDALFQPQLAFVEDGKLGGCGDVAVGLLP